MCSNSLTSSGLQNIRSMKRAYPMCQHDRASLNVSHRRNGVSLRCPRDTLTCGRSTGSIISGMSRLACATVKVLSRPFSQGFHVEAYVS